MKKSKIGPVIGIALCFIIMWIVGCPNPGGGTEGPAAPSTYRVTYDDNGSTGGTEPTDSTHYTEGETVTVLGNTGNLEKAGSSFIGWNTKSDGSGTAYGQGQTFTMGSASIVLYARWTSLPTYLVTYDANGATIGVPPTDTTHYLSGQMVTVLNNSGGLSRPGLGLAGWNTRMDGSGMTYTSGSTFAMGDTDITLYAVWEPTYTVTYTANATGTTGNVPIDSRAYLGGETVTVLGAGYLARAGYALVGWNTEADGGGTTYVAGQTFAMGNSNVILCAMWVPVYKVTYSGNGATWGNPPTDSTKYFRDQTVTVLGNTGLMERSGFAFTHWNTASDGGGVSYSAGQTFVMPNHDLTLYAQWIELTVTYDANGATSGTVPNGTTGSLGWPVTVQANSGSLAKTGLSFIGWNTQAGGGGTRYMPGQTFTMGPAPVTLYAMWTNLPTCTVTYDGNGSTGGAAAVDPNNYLPGDMVKVLHQGTLSKAGFNYAGWNTQPDWSGANYYTQQSFTMGSANVTLYAVWYVPGLNLLPTSGNPPSYYVSTSTVSGDVRIPPYLYGKPVVSIAAYAFRGCTGLTSVSIPATITSIGANAFEGCTGLTSVTIPDTVTSLGQCAFFQCTNLAAVSIGSGLSKLDMNLFYNCALTSVVIPRSITTVYAAFTRCTKLTSVTIPDTVTSLSSAFSDCTSLVSVSIPNSVRDLSGAFQSCTSLTGVTIPASVTNISHAFSNCTSLSSIVVPASVTSIGNHAFWKCTSLSSVTIPSSVTLIDEYAFDGCTSLAGITIPGSVTRIGFDAFLGCTALTSVTIPGSVSWMASQAFANCTSLAEVIINATTPPYTDFGNWFTGCANLTAIRVPPASLAAYQETEHWHDYAWLVVSQ